MAGKSSKPVKLTKPGESEPGLPPQLVRGCLRDINVRVYE